MDAIVIRFTTDLFDVTRERPNPINPIYGESLLRWLGDTLRDRVMVPQPEAEDWGWYVEIDWNGRGYLLGASASDEEGSGPREWVLQIVKHRSLSERLLGRAKMALDDECARIIRERLEREPAYADVTVD